MKDKRVITGLLACTLISNIIIPQNIFADGDVIGGSDNSNDIVSGSAGGSAPVYKTETPKKSQEPAQSKTIDLGERKIETPTPSRPIVNIPDNSNTTKKFEGSTIFNNDTKEDKPLPKSKKEVDNSSSRKKENTKIETKKETSSSKKKDNIKKSKSESKTKKKRYTTSGEDGNNMTIDDLVDKPATIDQDKPDNQQNTDINENNEVNNEEPNAEQPIDTNAEESSKPYIGDFIRPLGLEIETKRLEETRSKIISKCEETDSFLMNKIFFTIYMDRVANDITHYDSLSPIILNKRTGNKSQYITRGEFALLINSVLNSVGTVNNVQNMPLIDTKDTIFQTPVANIISLRLMKTNSLTSFDTYNLVTWGEFKESFRKLDKLLYLRENKKLSWDYDRDFQNRYKKIYDYQIDPDTFISKTMLVGLLTDLLSEYK